jgi:hypothetical protein
LLLLLLQWHTEVLHSSRTVNLHRLPQWCKLLLLLLLLCAGCSCLTLQGAQQCCSAPACSQPLT